MNRNGCVSCEHSSSMPLLWAHFANVQHVATFFDVVGQKCAVLMTYCNSNRLGQTLFLFKSFVDPLLPRNEGYHLLPAVFFCLHEQVRKSSLATLVLDPLYCLQQFLVELKRSHLSFLESGRSVTWTFARKSDDAKFL